MLRHLFNKKAFIPFVMAGHPSLEATKEVLIALSDAHVDLIELGVPFSDPVADGIVNQRAAEIALQQGVALSDILSLVRSLRETGFTTPIILFSYFNPIFAFGLDEFIREAVDAGIQGVLIVDLPPEEGSAFYQKLKQNNLEMVLLVSPTTNKDRFDTFKALDPAFIYYISSCRVTGMQEQLPLGLQQEVSQLKLDFPNHPVAVGFGISTPEQARRVAEVADGVIVGSALVHMLEKEGVIPFSTLVHSFVRALGNEEYLIRSSDECI